jgi:hypothetical protein
MKTENAELYVAPEITCYAMTCEGVLCESKEGTHEGIEFEDWY